MNLPIYNMNNSITTVERYWKKESDSLFTLYIFFDITTKRTAILTGLPLVILFKSTNYDARAELMNRNE